MFPSRLRWGLLLGLFLAARHVECKDDDEYDAEEMAHAISGTYNKFNVTDIYKPIILGARLFDEDVDRALPSKTSRSGICPSELKLKVKEKKGDLVIKLPKGLKSVDEDCPAAPGLEKTKVKLVDYSKNSTLSEFLKPQGEYYIASLPHTLLQCPGDKAPPFTSIQITSLKTLLVPKLHSTLSQLRVPDFIIDKILNLKIKRDENSEGEDRKRWKSIYIHRVVKALIKEIEKLDDYHMLVLSRQDPLVHQEYSKLIDPIVSKVTKENEKDGNEQPPFDVVRQLSTLQPSCVYLLDGHPADAEIKKKMETIVVALLPLFGHSRWTNMPIPSISFHPTASRCLPHGNFSIQSLSLSKPPTELTSILSEQDLVNWFTVSVNGEACSSARMESVLEMDYHSTKSPIGLGALSLSSDIVNFLEEQRIANSSGQSSSPLRTEYRDLASRLLDSLAKASIFVAHIDLGTCFQIEDRRSLDLVIVHRPAAHLYCNGFPRLERNFTYNCAGPPSELEEIKSKQYSAFLVQGKSKSDCLYSSSEFAASVLRGDIAIPSEEAEGSVDPIVIDNPSMSTIPTFIPII